MAVRARDEAHGDDRFENARELKANLFLLMGREHRDAVARVDAGPLHVLHEQVPGHRDQKEGQ